MLRAGYGIVGLLGVNDLSAFQKGAQMNRFSNSLVVINKVLQEYISIHDQVFKPSLRKSVRIPGLFKPISFGRHFDDLDVLSNKLKEVTISIDLEDQHSDFPVLYDYVTALHAAVEKLRVLCGKLLEKSKGASSYSMEEYKSDVASYQDMVVEYRAIGSDLNLRLSDVGIQGGMAKPAKTRWLINHLIHIIAGILFPYTFIWTTSGILASVLLSAITQGIDQFRIYRHYQKEFRVIDRVHGIKEGRSMSFELGSISQHCQVFIFKVIWYGFVTMLVAGFRR